MDTGQIRSSFRCGDDHNHHPETSGSTQHNSASLIRPWRTTTTLRMTTTVGWASELKLDRRRGKRLICHVQNLFQTKQSKLTKVNITLDLDSSWLWRITLTANTITILHANNSLWQTTNTRPFRAIQSQFKRINITPNSPAQCSHNQKLWTLWISTNLEKQEDKDPIQWYTTMATRSGSESRTTHKRESDGSYPKGFERAAARIAIDGDDNHIAAETR